MRVFASAVLAAAALGLAACGDSDDSGGSSSDKDPKAILTDVASAVRGLESYHLDMKVKDKDGPGTLTADVNKDGDFKMTLSQNGQGFDVLVVDKATYLKADGGFWKSQASGQQGEQLAQALGGKWVKSKQFAATDLTGVVGMLQPETLAHCLTTDVGKVTKKGDGEVGGQKAVVLADDGSNPGGVAGELYVAAEGKALPLRIVQTGTKRTPGQGDKRCGSDSGDTSSSDVTLSKFDEPVDIAAPKDTVDLDALQQSQQQGSS
ncbi:LppX_LprAFG lipoprotein [Conexibacter sp. SYSU D00693]|uniref:LppX_LprAFG lipoprotein n=1 Tax=Conexibacter sp. SYSU D00693 TaxID=2812560 RepID=UPI00196ADC40|nr:LppX_LprAFG lipoprotein [Conexibacter sp. SYSU D00693]